MSYGWLFTTALLVLISVVLYILTVFFAARGFINSDRGGCLIGLIGLVLTAATITATVWAGSHLG